MKYIVVLGDGMAGWPLEELGGKTTLEAADTPVMDRLAEKAEIGMASMVPEDMAPGSDTANLSVMGYDPKIYYTGRSPLEALSIGVDMADDDVSFRCNLVTLSEKEDKYEDRHMIDHSSSEISTEDAEILLEALKQGLAREGYAFYAGTSYRHLLVWSHGEVSELTPPHDILTKRVGDYLPEDRVLREMMEKSYEILSAHPLNKERRAKGLHPANSAWFWGAGTRPALTSFEERTGKKGVMISAVDLLKGLAVGADMERILVEGANGGLHTNYEGKADAAADALLTGGFDFAYVHVEAPDEMGHQGSTEDKIKAIEYLDGRVIGRITGRLDQAGEDYRIMVLPDHPTPIKVRTHTKDPVPYMIYDSRRADSGLVHTYGESAARQSGLSWPDGYRLIDHLLELDER
ncbi:cofactor-independent phosphoglycerate mutase [Lachnospiraceae bacterium DSM 108991]|uniref:Cofactor-independent phosphoglycerate mutase n=2 Tax=Lachnospiraceae TaxID=186803 RepID=A0A921LF73_9FIRM|nr:MULTISPECIES: cofactor-independent phosphoglycerate mutase [Lachnospiraceae]MBE5062776.1 cofactor-independent phosphoglycerate mutase [Claveliimonas monacensis]HJF93297.1 cofactor-independent phosphoglycerate mutase [Lachnoclostridium phocaeense]